MQPRKKNTIPAVSHTHFPVRVTRKTEKALQGIITTHHRTTWGEAVNLIFNLFNQNSDLFPGLPPINTLPPCIFRRAPINRFAVGASSSRNISCKLDAGAWDWIHALAKRTGASPQNTAAAVLFCHAELAQSIMNPCEVVK